MGTSPTYVPVIRTGVDVSFGDLTATGNLSVAGTSTLTGDVSCGNNLSVAGASTLTGNATVGGTLGVTGNTTLGGLSVLQPASMNTINASATTVTQLTVSGQTFLHGALTSTGAAAASVALWGQVTGDANARVQLREDGRIDWGPGTAALDTQLSRSGVNALETPGFFAMGSGQSGGNFSVFGTALVLGSAGTTLQIKEGANASMGVATLTLGSVTVNTTKVTDNSRIFLTVQQIGTVSAPKAMTVSGVTPGASFQIVSEDATDTSTVAWHIIEPAP